MERCICRECRHCDPVIGCKAVDLEQGHSDFACRYGRFVSTITSRYGHLGRWQFRRIGSGNGVLMATLKGRHGGVEVWGGNAHRQEVWAAPKGSASRLVSTDGTPDAMDEACRIAQIEPTLDLEVSDA